MTEEIRIDLTLPSEWTRIDVARQAVQMATRAVYAEGELDDALAMVASELLENAVKYGRSDEASVRFSMSTGPTGEIWISVSNAVETQSDHEQKLRSRIEWIRNFDSPRDAYLEALTQIYAEIDVQARCEEESAGGSASASGGLGIVRIAYEGGCTLEAARLEPGWLTVTARHPLAGAAVHA